MLLPLCTSACTLPTLVRRGGRMLFISILAILLHASAVRAQNAPPEKPKVTRILFLLDASGSMMAPWEGQPRWEVAKRLLPTPTWSWACACTGTSRPTPSKTAKIRA
jgi:hypothetical protein